MVNEQGIAQSIQSLQERQNQLRQQQQFIENLEQQRDDRQGQIDESRDQLTSIQAVRTIPFGQRKQALQQIQSAERELQDAFTQQIGGGVSPDQARQMIAQNQTALQEEVNRLSELQRDIDRAKNVAEQIVFKGDGRAIFALENERQRELFRQFKDQFVAGNINVALKGGQLTDFARRSLEARKGISQLPTGELFFTSPEAASKFANPGSNVPVMVDGQIKNLPQVDVNFNQSIPIDTNKFNQFQRDNGLPLPLRSVFTREDIIGPGGRLRIPGINNQGDQLFITGQGTQTFDVDLPTIGTLDNPQFSFTPVTAFDQEFTNDFPELPSVNQGTVPIEVDLPSLDEIRNRQATPAPELSQTLANILATPVGTVNIPGQPEFGTRFSTPSLPSIDSITGSQREFVIDVLPQQQQPIVSQFNTPQFGTQPVDFQTPQTSDILQRTFIDRLLDEQTGSTIRTRNVATDGISIDPSLLPDISGQPTEIPITVKDVLEFQAIPSDTIQGAIEAGIDFTERKLTGTTAKEQFDIKVAEIQEQVADGSLSPTVAETRLNRLQSEFSNQQLNRNLPGVVVGAGLDVAVGLANPIAGAGLFASDISAITAQAPEIIQAGQQNPLGTAALVGAGVIAGSAATKGVDVFKNRGFSSLDPTTKFKGYTEIEDVLKTKIVEDADAARVLDDIGIGIDDIATNRVNSFRTISVDIPSRKGQKVELELIEFVKDGELRIGGIEKVNGEVKNVISGSGVGNELQSIVEISRRSFEKNNPGGGKEITKDVFVNDLKNKLRVELEDGLPKSIDPENRQVENDFIEFRDIETYKTRSNKQLLSIIEDSSEKVNDLKFELSIARRPQRVRKLKTDLFKEKKRLSTAQAELNLKLIPTFAGSTDLSVSLQQGQRLFTDARLKELKSEGTFTSSTLNKLKELEEKNLINKQDLFAITTSKAERRFRRPRGSEQIMQRGSATLELETGSITAQEAILKSPDIDVTFKKSLTERDLPDDVIQVEVAGTQELSTLRTFEQEGKVSPTAQIAKTEKDITFRKVDDTIKLDEVPKRTEARSLDSTPSDSSPGNQILKQETSQFPEFASTSRKLSEPVQQVGFDGAVNILAKNIQSELKTAGQVSRGITPISSGLSPTLRSLDNLSDQAKVAVIDRVNEISTQASGNGVLTAEQIDVSTLQGVSQDLGQRNLQLSRQDVNFGNDTIVRQEQLPFQRQRSLQRSNTLSRTRQDFELRKQNQVDITTRPPVTTPRIDTNTLNDIRKKLSKTAKGEPTKSYDVIAGTGKRAKKVGNDLPFNRANKVGLEVTRNDLRASYKLVPQAKAPKKSEVGVPSFAGFRRSKVDPGRIVERKNQRLRQGKETKDILKFRSPKTGGSKRF